MTYDFYDDEQEQPFYDEDRIRTLKNLLANVGAQLSVMAPAPLLRTIRLRASREVLPYLATELRSRYAARPVLIVADDTRETSDNFSLTYLFDLPTHAEFVLVETAIPASDPTFPSLATYSARASRCEREIHDLFGLVAKDHPDLRPLVRRGWPEGYFPLRKDASPPPKRALAAPPDTLSALSDEESYTITLGPLQAGADGPAIFRLTVRGETITALETQLGFSHRGVERHFENLPRVQTLDLAERVCGDSGVAHALAYCQALEAIAESEIPAKATLTRVVLLELERIANHVRNAGIVCGAAGFSFAQTHAARLYEDLLRLNARLSGHRLLRGIIVPGGVAREFPPDIISDVRATIARFYADFGEIVALIKHTPFLPERLRTIGRLTTDSARELQVVGPVGRASGVDADARRDRPFAAYADLPFNVPLYQEGDVWARLMIRIDEIHEAVGLIKLALDRLKPGAFLAPLGSLPARATGLGLVEGWRGPIIYWVATGVEDQIARCKILDPSFINWPALSLAIQYNDIADFTLCFHSFALAAAGHDL